jgi:hypothetical protein
VTANVREEEEEEEEEECYQQLGINNRTVTIQVIIHI